MEVNWLILALTAFVEAWLLLWHQIEKSNQAEWNRSC